MQAVKLNIGAGKTKIPGFTPIDRMFGDEAYPLKYETNSVSEIRASHILEHFSFQDAFTALEDWVRVLEPGGRLRIAVPDVDKCLAGGDKNRLFYLMGGQTDDNDFHKSAYDRHRLRQTLEQAGLEQVEEWESDGLDTSSHPVSLNLQGVKPATADIPAIGAPYPDHKTAKLSDVKIAAYMTLPRYEAVASRSIAETALRKLGIGLATSQGVFWGQCMQRMFNDAIEQGVDWILSLDSDSLFNEQHVSDLFDVFGQHPEADALAALQCRRGKPFPLLTIGGSQEAQLESLEPLLVTTAHFGLTLIRVDALKDVPKPWFYSQPDEDGEYGDNRLDDDIWFWHQWRLAGKKIYVAPSVSIGHLEETVAVFDGELQPKHEYIAEWRSKHLNQKQSDS
tara:strand:+ start:248 stop:1429 length:1182 start_codon:yes stop_codon:yes gene_type:complete